MLRQRPFTLRRSRRLRGSTHAQSKEEWCTDAPSPPDELELGGLHGYKGIIGCGRAVGYFRRSAFLPRPNNPVLSSRMVAGSGVAAGPGSWIRVNCEAPANEGSMVIVGSILDSQVPELSRTRHVAVRSIS